MNIFNWLTRKDPEVRAKSGIRYRIVFLSPFFELEVSSGSGDWQTVHAQEGVMHDSDPHTMLYPMLRFPSYDEAAVYAKELLKLSSVYNPWFLHYYSAPPASFMSHRPRLSQSEFKDLNTGSFILAPKRPD